MNSKLKNKNFFINYNEVTLDPITNFYKKIENSIDDVLNVIFNEYENENTELIHKQTKQLEEIKLIKNSIENEYKNNNIKMKKIGNGFIIFFCFLIIGLFLIPIFISNKKVIDKFNAFRSEKENLIQDIESDAETLAIKYLSNISYSEILYKIGKIYNIPFSNSTHPLLLKTLKQYSNFKEITSSIVFKYKNTPIISFLAKFVNTRDELYSNSMTFPYTEYVTSTNSNGEIETKAITKYETLIATHKEPTPFVDKKSKILLLTNFEPDLNFTTNSKKYIKFENHEFTKIFKVNNDENEINQHLLQFFTIKAQEDYVKWSKISDDIYFKKEGLVFETNFSNKNVLNVINSEFNSGFKTDKFLSIENSINSIKQDIKEFFLEIANKIMLPIISPSINRELYQYNKNYKISNEPIEINKNLNSDVEYMVSKISKKYNLCFCNTEYDKSKSPFIKILNHEIGNDGFHKINLNLCSFNYTKKIKNVLVSGVNVGIQTIPVEYKEYFLVSEPKVVYILPKKNTDKHNLFAISHNIFNTYFDFDSSSFDYKTNHLGGIHFLKPKSLVKDLSNEKKLFNENIKKIRTLIKEHISIESFDDGYAIILNSYDAKMYSNTETLNTIAELKKIIKHLNSFL